MNKGARILVVDDVEIFRDVVVDVLSSWGFTNVGMAQDGEDALQHLRDRATSLVISDYQMPRMNGLQLLEAMSVNGALRDTRFILMSSSMVDELRIKAMALGARACMSKGDIYKGLQGMVQQVLVSN